MSIMLKLTHVDGIRLRQQQAHTVEHTKDKTVEKIDPLTGDKTVEKTKEVTHTSVEWRFVKTQEANGKTVEECQQDEDNRRVGSDGKKLKLGTYTIYVTAGSKNLVVERKGKVSSFDFKNPAVRNQARIQYQKLVPNGKKTKDDKPVHEWKNDGAAQYVPPNTFAGVFVGDGQRAIVDEMPT